MQQESIYRHEVMVRISHADFERLAKRFSELLGESVYQRVVMSAYDEKSSLAVFLFVSRVVGDNSPVLTFVRELGHIEDLVWVSVQDTFPNSAPPRNQFTWDDRPLNLPYDR